MSDSQNIVWAIPFILFACLMIVWCICCCVCSCYKSQYESAFPSHSADPSQLVSKPISISTFSEDPV